MEILSKPKRIPIVLQAFYETFNVEQPFEAYDGANHTFYPVQGKFEVEKIRESSERNFYKTISNEKD